MSDDRRAPPLSPTWIHSALLTRSSQDEQELDRPVILQPPRGNDSPIREEDRDRTHHSQGIAVIPGGEAGGDWVADAVHHEEASRAHCEGLADDWSRTKSDRCRQRERCVRVGPPYP